MAVAARLFIARRPASGPLQWLLLAAALLGSGCEAFEDAPDDEGDVAGQDDGFFDGPVGGSPALPMPVPQTPIPDPAAVPAPLPPLVPAPPLPPPAVCIDEDQDGYGDNCMLGSDCDDTDPFLGPSCDACDDRTGCGGTFSDECVIDPIARQPLQPVTDDRPRIETDVTAMGECALTLPVDDDGLVPAVGTLEVLYRDYCDGDQLELHALVYDVALPEHTAVTFEVCVTDVDEIESCTWQQIAHVAAGDACEVDTDCHVGERCEPNPSGGICSALYTAPCESDDECTDTALCQDGHCASFTQPVDFGRYVQNTYGRHWAVRITLQANPERTLAPTLHDAYVPYSCTWSI